jgi:hypothetical protein
MLTAYLDERRRPWRREQATDPLPEPPQVSPTDIVDRVTLLGLLDRLPPRLRAVLVLRFFDDLSVEQTAEALGCACGPLWTSIGVIIRERRVGAARRAGFAGLALATVLGTALAAPTLFAGREPPDAAAGATRGARPRPAAGLPHQPVAPHPRPAQRLCRPVPMPCSGICTGRPPHGKNWAINIQPGDMFDRSAILRVAVVDRTGQPPYGR